MRIFQHTSRERGLWRAWLKNGQSVEISCGRRGWEFGAGIHIHSNDADRGDRMLFLKFWRVTAVLPLGIVPDPWPPIGGPQWSAYASQEFGLLFRWGMRRKSFDWPWSWHTLAYETMLKDGSWRELDWDARQRHAYSETHPYAYTLRSGKVQNRTATVTKRRHVITWRAFRRIGWPRWVRESIYVEFDGEVGERSGSWKGGCIGCSYDILPHETLGCALRRMEAERVFR